MEGKRVYFDHAFRMVAWGPAVKPLGVFTKIAESLDSVFAKEHQPKEQDKEEERYVNRENDEYVLMIFTKIMYVFFAIIVAVVLFFAARKGISFLRERMVGSEPFNKVTGKANMNISELELRNPNDLSGSKQRLISL